MEMRVLIVFLVIYLIYRFLRNISVFTMRSRPVHEQEQEPPVTPPKQSKLIEKDEGEYVDYEDVK